MNLVWRQRPTFQHIIKIKIHFVPNLTSILAKQTNRLASLSIIILLISIDK